MSRAGYYVGCAGWALRKEHHPLFPLEGTHLERYSKIFNAVEINSSFYRPHKKETYARWKESVPPDFRFSVKLIREVTHVRRLKDAEAVLERFVDETSGLGEKLGVILVQLPPSLAYDARDAARCFDFLRAHSDCALALEARHPSWFMRQASEWRDCMRLGGVGADPAPVPQGADATGPLRYYRWHGSPRIYYSAYSPSALSELAERMQRDTEAGRQAWAILDNTALGNATTDALHLTHELRRAASRFRNFAINF